MRSSGKLKSGNIRRDDAVVDEGGLSEASATALLSFLAPSLLHFPVNI